MRAGVLLLGMTEWFWVMPHAVVCRSYSFRVSFAGFFRFFLVTFYLGVFRAERR